MATARFWRIIGIDTWGSGDLELGELQLYDAIGRVDALATLSCSHAPAAGSLTNLQDDNAATVCRFAATDCRSALFALTWDMGAGNTATVYAVKIGGGVDKSTFIERFDLQYSSDGVAWDKVGLVSSLGATFPGAYTSAVRELTPPDVAWDRTRAPASVIYSNNDTTIQINTPNKTTVSSVNRSSGIRQFEITVGNTNDTLLGVVAPTYDVAARSYISGSDGWALYGINGGFYHNGTSTFGSTGSWVAGVVIGVVINFTTGVMTYYKNGVSLGCGYTDLAGKTVAPAAATSIASVIANLATLSLKYPVAGATPWAVNTDYMPLSGPAMLRASQPAGPLRLATGLPATTGVTLQNHNGSVRDIEFGGRGRVRGTVKEKGTPNTPLKRRVRLENERSALTVRETWSDPVTGVYDFQYVDAGQAYSVKTYDYLNNFRAVIADNLTLVNGGVELMP